jgi:hypothetical protein
MPRDIEHSKRVKEIAEQLIPQYHLHLSHAKIAYLMRKAPANSTGPNPSKRARVRRAMATASAVSYKMHILSGYDFILEVDEVYWDVLSLEQQMALIDHELAHMMKDEDGYYCADHDVEEFISIVERHGAWDSGLEALHGVMQFALPFQDKPEEEVPETATVQ